jgi:ABC-type antimicrobial peptide transport system, ATPase component
MTTLLNAQNISKSYPIGKNNDLQVLKDVSLSIAHGEFVSIMGPSGSGKSTLLYNISGMDRASSGTVTFNGREISKMSEKELAKVRLTKMGFIFQKSNLLNNLSVLDNILVAAYLDARENKTSINNRALGLMEQTGISHLKNNDITQASGGELQRAAICRALINQPDILFGDEPTGALNSSSTNEMMDILDTINKRGSSILLVTHDARVAARGERVLFMLDGQIKGEYVLGKFHSEKDDWKQRETALAAWLAKMGF